MDEIERRRLDWVANATPGDPMPPDLFPADPSVSNWGIYVSRAAKSALAEIDRLREGRPTRSAAASLNETCRKRLEWLALGDGSMMPPGLFPVTDRGLIPPLAEMAQGALDEIERLSQLAEGKR